MKKTTLNRMLLTVWLMSGALSVFAQPLKEKKNVRIYEHHSSSINGGKAFGNGANGAMCGYDFVKHQHYGSFNPANMGKWSAAEAANIDLVEHNGYYGNRGLFGFTSATSSIWGGDIAGNGKTTFHPAPSGFNYDTVKDARTLRAAHPIVIAANTVNAATVGKVYICRIRNSDTFVAMKITAVKNLPSNYKGGDTASVYFDFDYKYGLAYKTGIDDVEAVPGFSIFPNPAAGTIRLADIPAQVQLHKATVNIADVSGKTVYTQPAAAGNINHNLPAGMYIVTLTDGQYTAREKLVVVQ